MKWRYLFFAVLIGLCSLFTCNLGFCNSEIHVGIYKGMGSEGIYESLKDKEGITGELIKSLSPSVLSKYNIIILSHVRGLSSTRDYLRSYRALLRRYVEIGGGIILTHDSCGYRGLFKNAPLFPEIEKAIGRKDTFFMKKVKRVNHPVLKDLAPEIRHGYSDHIQMEAGEKGKVLIIDEDNKAVVVVGRYGKGKIVAMGNLAGHWAIKQELKKYNGKEKKLEGEELKLLLNSIKWLNEGPLFKTVSRSQLKESLKGVRGKRKVIAKQRELVFSDEFSYRKQAQIKKWHIPEVSPGKPAWKKAGMVRTPRQGILDCSHEGYELSAKSFSKSPIKDDFILSFKITTISIYRNYKGRFDVCLLDKDKNGYGASISLGSTSYTNSLLRIDKGKKTVIAEAKGDKRSFPVSKQGGLLDIRLSLSETGEISLKSAGKEIVTTKDTQYKEFTKLTFVVKGAESRFGIDDVKLAASFKKIELAKEEKRPLIIPQPKEIVENGKRFALTSGTQIITSSSKKANTYHLPELIEEIEGRYGIKLSLKTYEDMDKNMPSIYIGEPGSDSNFRKICNKEIIKLVKAIPSKEGYMLEVIDKKVFIGGVSERGTFYGIQSLIQLIKKEGDNLYIQGVKIKDWPDMKIRGAHIWLKGRGVWTRPINVKNVKKLLKVLYRLKANTVVMGSKRLAWKTYPELAGYDCNWTLGDVREVAEYAKKHFIEVVPESVGLSHTGFPAFFSDKKRKTGFWKWVLKERILEDPDPGYHRSAFCPSNPLSIKMILDMTGELLDVVPRAKLVQTGNDEIRPMCVCPRCKGKDPAKLLANYLNKHHKFLADRGCRMMMWQDMLLDSNQFKKIEGAGTVALSNASPHWPNRTHPALDMISKDIIILSWYYGDKPLRPDYKYLKDKGFDVIAHPGSVYNLPIPNNYYTATEAKKAGILGMITFGWASAWHLNPTVNDTLGTIYGWAVPEIKEPPFVFQEVYQDFYQEIKPSSKGDVIKLDISKYTNSSRTDKEADDGKDWFDYGPDQDFSTLKTGELRYKQYRFNIVDEKENQGKDCIIVVGKDVESEAPVELKGIRVGRKAKSIIFLHTSIGGPHSKQIGAYAVNYTDGTKKTVPIVWGQNIGPWLMDVGHSGSAFYKSFYQYGYFSDSRLAYIGYTPMGEKINLQALEWINPEPDKEIESLDIKVTRNNAGIRIALLALSIVK